MKKPIESILQQLQLSICYYSHFSAKDPIHLGVALAHWFYFPPCSGTPAISLGRPTKKSIR